MSVNPEDWDVDLAFQNFKLQLCLNENEADVEIVTLPRKRILVSENSNADHY